MRASAAPTTAVALVRPSPTAAAISLACAQSIAVSLVSRMFYPENRFPLFREML
jgi:hypothetical protein